MEYPIYLKNTVDQIRETVVKVDSENHSIEINLWIQTKSFMVDEGKSKSSVDIMLFDYQPATESDWIHAVKKLHDEVLKFANENLKVTSLEITVEDL